MTNLTSLTAEDIVSGVIAVGHALIDNLPTVGDEIVRLRVDLEEATADRDLLQGQVDGLQESLFQAKVKAEQCAKDLLKEAKAHNATRIDRERINLDLMALTAAYGGVERERDTALTRAEEARAENARLEQQRADDRLTIADLEQALADCNGGEG